MQQVPSIDDSTKYIDLNPAGNYFGGQGVPPMDPAIMVYGGQYPSDVDIFSLDNTTDLMEQSAPADFQTAPDLTTLGYPLLTTGDLEQKMAQSD